ncbi:helix-turn-helix transcriptional regulator [Gemelliphila palaticanis]|uniref:Helix-turn-helix transcriptional regulator n=1 Tax=Gemelliphila palaticanis TaxID=81950 RepID=A0ABX2SZD8_9BACL|nr:AraC family transcriptional regulator [Gemella palaticanis]MBF0715793.1 helix-turn-helix transcriptional regulator [Gemella palaticanis]NYS47723.1 helix-turn-helix transcriptional regulator [Gemella palaticanis]
MNITLNKLNKIKNILDIDEKVIEGSFDNYEEAISQINISNKDVLKVVSRYLIKNKDEIINDLKNGKLIKTISSLGMYSLFIPSENNNSFFLLSPYLDYNYSLESYQELLANQGIILDDELSEKLYNIEVITKKTFNNLLQLLFDLEEIDFNKIVIYEDIDIKNLKKSSFDRQYIIRDILERKAEFNKELKNAAIKGDITRISMIFDLEFNYNSKNLEDNKLKEKSNYINDVLHFAFSDSEANPIDVNALWVKIKNKIDNYDFSSDIIREYCLLIDKEKYKDKQQVVRNCILYINDHIREKINLNDISDYLDVNKSYLSSIFNREMGFSIVDYIHKRRISNSKYLLSNTDFSISEISDYIGYFDTSYFIRIFKTVTKTTPLKYRENFSN